MDVCVKETVVSAATTLILKEIWDANFSEELKCEREPDNISVRYAVTIKKDGSSAT